MIELCTKLKLTKLYYVLRLVLTGKFQEAWFYWTFVGREKSGLKQEDFNDVYYPDDD